MPLLYIHILPLLMLVCVLGCVYKHYYTYMYCSY